MYLTLRQLIYVFQRKFGIDSIKNHVVDIEREPKAF